MTDKSNAGKNGFGEAFEAIRREISPFQRPSRLKSIWQLSNTLLAYIALWVLIYFLKDYSYWLTLPLVLLAAGFLIRIFIIFHDCGHYSFFRSRRANHFWGRVTGLLTFTPFYYWRMSHARHHWTSGNLDKRGQGDVWTMTVSEYQNAPFKTKLKYRLYRNPLVMFFLGPLLILLVNYRFPGRGAGIKDKVSVYGTNVALIGLAVLMSFLIGPKTYLIFQFFILYIGMVGGVWLFYVQHQFEGVYWSGDKEWDFVEASLKGASFYKLPPVLRWFTGNIGYHHVHHLSPGIPNYSLPKCHDRIPVFQRVKPIKLFSSLRSLRYRLWDEKNGHLVGFGRSPEAR